MDIYSQGVSPNLIEGKSVNRQEGEVPSSCLVDGEVTHNVRMLVWMTTRYLSIAHTEHAPVSVYILLPKDIKGGINGGVISR